MFDRSITFVEQFNPEMAKLLVDAGSCQVHKVRAIVEELMFQLRDFYSSQDRGKEKQPILARAKQLMTVAERVGAAAPGLIQVASKIYDAINRLPL